jgi:hypothetical protein
MKDETLATLGAVSNRYWEAAFGPTTDAPFNPATAISVGTPYIGCRQPQHVSAPEIDIWPSTR